MSEKKSTESETRIEREMREHPDLFDEGDSRPLRTPEEIGISVPPEFREAPPDAGQDEPGKD